MRLVCLLLGLSPATACSAAEPVVLVHAGRPAAVIVLTARAATRQRQAAADLQHYVEKRTGVRLPLHEDGKAVAGAGLYIGPCEPSRDSDLPAPDLNPETYAIRLRDGNVFFAGRHPTPTAFAVYSFLEDALGIRWFAPGDAWEYVPPATPGELAVTVHEQVGTPDTSPRIWSGHAWFPSWKRWNLRNKTVLSEVVPRRQFQNNLFRVFPPAKYGVIHPEYYPLVKGVRWIPPRGSLRWRPCESNPGVIAATVAYARRWFDTHPDIDSFSVGMDDISHLCGCRSCRALDAHPDSYEKHRFSDRHYKFVNAVARELAKTRPHRYVGTLIYSIARTLPETVPKLEDNVFGYLTETSALWWQPGRKEADQALTREWAKRCRHLSRYDYYGMGTFCPRFYPHTMAEQIKFDKSLGLEGMYTEVYTFLPHTAPMIWAFAKLQWDASLEIDALLNEFYTKMFGKAAGTMSRYFALLEHAWNTPRPGRDGWVHRNLVRQVLSLSPADCDRGSTLLDQAERQAESDPCRQRIAVIHAALRYAAYPVKEYALSQQLTTRVIGDRRGADRTVAQVEELGRLSARRQRFWEAAPKRNDLLGETLRGLIGKKYLVTGQVAGVETGGAAGAVKALAWYAAHDPNQLPAVTDRLTHALPAGPVSETLNAFLWVQQTHPPNLAKNPGFEEQGPNTVKREKDWTTTGAPPGWSVWNRAGDSAFTVEAGIGRHRSAAARIAGGAGGVYLQTLPVKPGERYLCLVWARYEGPVQSRAGIFGVRFRTPTGAWHPRRDLEPQLDLSPSPKWQPLILVVKTPKGATSLVLLLGSTALTNGGAVVFDEAAVYRIPETAGGGKE